MINNRHGKGNPCQERSRGAGGFADGESDGGSQGDARADACGGTQVGIDVIDLCRIFNFVEERAKSFEFSCMLIRVDQGVNCV